MKLIQFPTLTEGFEVYINPQYVVQVQALEIRDDANIPQYRPHPMRTAIWVNLPFNENTDRDSRVIVELPIKTVIAMITQSVRRRVADR